MAQGPEAKIVAKILKRLNEVGYAIKFHGSAMSKGGEPDILACVMGRMVRVEVKVPGNKPTPRQYHQLRQWEKAGALSGWATSVEEVDALLGHLDDPSWRNPQLA